MLMLAIMPGTVIDQGLQLVLGFNYGAKRYEQPLKAINIIIAKATNCSVAVFLVLYFVPELVIRVFTNDNELIALGSYALRRVFLALYVIGFMMVGSLIFQSIGKAAQSFISSILRAALFLIPLVFILPRYLKLDDVWLAFPIADAFTFLLALLLLLPQIRGPKSGGFVNHGEIRRSLAGTVSD